MEDTSLNHIREPILAEITSLPATNSSQLPQKENHSTSDDNRLPEECFGNPYITGIHRLPNEILIKIITGLPLLDRKKTRLVCKRWLDVNNVRQISKKEKFTCFGYNDVNLMLQNTQNSERRIINIEFDFVNYTTLGLDRSLEFWKACGWRIESLLFRHCCISYKTLLFLIEHCAHLENLTITNCLLPSEQQLMPSTAIETLKEMKLRRAHQKLLNFLASNRKLLISNFIKVLVLVGIHRNLDDFDFVSGNLTKKEIADLLQEESSFDQNFQLLSLKQKNGSWGKRSSKIPRWKYPYEVVIEEIRGENHYLLICRSWTLSVLN